MPDYAVNLSELDAVVAHASDLTVRVDSWLLDLNSLLTRLHETWSGDAASAQLDAYRQWEMGAQQMRTSLDELRAAAHTAHTNYVSAVSANSKMWQ